MNSHYGSKSLTGYFITILKLAQKICQLSRLNGSCHINS